MRPIILKVILGLSLSLTLGCNDSFFQGSTGKNEAFRSGSAVGSEDNTPKGGEGFVDDSEDAIQDNVMLESLVSLYEVKEIFTFDGSVKNEVDYLFVLDNSCSAETLLENSQKAMLDLVSLPNVLPGEPKIATMTTAHGAFDDLTKLGIGLRSFEYSTIEPGFLSFYNKGARDNFVSQIGSNANYELAGCENSWFAPDETNVAGELCIEAAFQTRSKCTGTEAGILAFTQLLEKNEGSPMFRSGANVNVIFISDTHDPGINVDSDNGKAIIERHLPYSEIVKKVADDNLVNSLKFHAVAPADVNSTCAETYRNGSYNKLVADSGGKSADCSAAVNYSDFMKDMVEISKVPDMATFILSESFDSVVAIKVGGKVVTDYDYNPSTNGITLRNLDFTTVVPVEIVYLAK